jgi:hypothetical protein
MKSTKLVPCSKTNVRLSFSLSQVRLYYGKVGDTNTPRSTPMA